VAAAGCAAPRPVPEIRTPCPHAAAGSFEAVYRAGWSPASGRGVSFRIWVAAGGPGRLRLEVAGRLGGTWLSVALEGGELTAVSPGSGQHLQAPDRSGLLGSVTGWPLEAEQVPRLLFGCAEAPGGPLEVRYDDWRQEEGGRVPGRVSVERPGEAGGVLTLRLESLSLGPVAPEVFALEPPPGSRAVAPPAPGAPAPLWVLGEAEP
jgi:hypothetical protein